MQPIDFRLHADHVELLYPKYVQTVLFSGSTGTRYSCKKDVVIHVGIDLGMDLCGRHLFLHNHQKLGSAAIVTEQEFTDGEQVTLVEAACPNTSLQIVELGLQQVLRQEPYPLLTYTAKRSSTSLAAMSVGARPLTRS